MENKKLFPAYHPLIGKQDASTFLQSINITNENDIEKVVSLTKHSTPTIEYEKALSLTKTKDDEFSFTSFMQRIEKMHIGITRTVLTKKNLLPNYVRLCDLDSAIFFNEYISEHSNKAAHAIDKSLSTSLDLKAQGIVIPKNMLTELDISHAKNAFKMSVYANVAPRDDTIYSIKLSKKDIFYCTTYSIPIITDICMTRLRIILNDSKLLPVFAKVIGMGLTEAQDKINSEHYIVYEDLISQCYALLPKLKDTPKISAYTDVFDYIIILNNFIKAKIQQDKINTQTQQDISIFQESALQELYIHSKGVPHVKLDEFLKKLANKQGIVDEELIKTSIETFNEEFVTTAENPDNKKLKQGACIIIDGVCINSAIILDILTGHFNEICAEFKKYYINLLKRFLENSLSVKDNVFLSEETLEVATHQKLQELEPMYALILKSPVLLASLLSQKITLGNNNALSTMSTSRKLSLFFNLRTKEILPWHKIFNVNLSVFAEEAYLKIGKLRRYWMIFTGKFKSIKERIEKLEKLSSTMQVDLKEVKELAKKQKDRTQKDKKEASIKTR